MSVLILNMLVVAQLAHAISDALRPYTCACASDLQRRESARDGHT